ncbi:hypothetical protein QAD02_022626 [Eretmocerus hayati]|uniref:Uncharacterized protein n=1 Tax=Eretmocerus hayati TaxID=131215 RepID=A0ACC2PWU5_9HYME|nr:hypothetical protein QAD02_022626 [Eretmocerus hayati]
MSGETTLYIQQLAFTCHNCDETFWENPVDPLSPANDWQVQAAALRQQPNNQAHMCPDCGKVYLAQRSLWRHRKFECVNAKPRLSCDLCDYHTPHKWSMDNHKKKRH